MCVYGCVCNAQDFLLLHFHIMYFSIPKLHGLLGYYYYSNYLTIFNSFPLLLCHKGSHRFVAGCRSIDASLFYQEEFISLDLISKVHSFQLTWTRPSYLFNFTREELGKITSNYLPFAYMNTGETRKKKTQKGK